jgi:hypothetical protein
MTIKMKDARGTTIRVGDRVRIIGMPDLSGMSKTAKAESEIVFQHLVGTYKRITDIDQIGNAGIRFRIRTMKKLEYHWVSLEPHLILKPKRKRASNQAVKVRLPAGRVAAPHR